MRIACILDATSQCWQIDRIRGQTLSGCQWWCTSSLIATLKYFEQLIYLSIVRTVVRRVEWSVNRSVAWTVARALAQAIVWASVWNVVQTITQTIARHHTSTCRCWLLSRSYIGCFVGSSARTRLAQRSLLLPALHELNLVYSLHTYVCTKYTTRIN